MKGAWPRGRSFAEGKGGGRRICKSRGFHLFIYLFYPLSLQFVICNFISYFLPPKLHWPPLNDFAFLEMWSCAGAARKTGCPRCAFLKHLFLTLTQEGEISAELRKNNFSA